LIQDATPSALKNARRSVVFVDDATKLANCCEVLSTNLGAFAIDAERASGFRYGQRAYLIQVARREGPIFLIDPAAISPESRPEEFAELATLLSADTWLLHAATQDLPCLAELGLFPTRIFDTELGSRIAGLPRVGLGAVVEHYLNLSLAKEHSAVDWSKRPLDQSWLDYAALDVDVLHELADALEGDLTEKNKLPWAIDEFAHLLKFKPKPENPERWRNMSGLHEVKSQVGLSVARELWRSREALAIKLDVAPGRLIPDASISHVAKTMPKTRPELAADKSFAGRASRSYLDTWWAATEAGRNSRDLPDLKMASVGIPNHRSWPNRWPNAHKRLICARHYLSELAKLNDLPLENMVSPDTIRQVCWVEREGATTEQIATELESLSSRPWQIALIAETLAKSISLSQTFEVEKPEAENAELET
jgi:ribonuclease D